MKVVAGGTVLLSESTEIQAREPDTEEASDVILGQTAALPCCCTPSEAAVSMDTAGALMQRSGAYLRLLL
jgi:hypothetical protein